MQTLEERSRSVCVDMEPSPRYFITIQVVVKNVECDSTAAKMGLHRQYSHTLYPC